MEKNWIVVTGAGRGIGRTIALGCAADGYPVFLSARTEKELCETASLIEAQGKGRVDLFPCDVSQRSEVESLFKKLDTLGELSALVAAAAIHGPIGSFESICDEAWEKAVQINLMGSVYCAQQAVLRLKGRKKGRIIFFSGGGQGAMPNFSAYVTSKGGIWRLTETLGAELSESGIMVNAIAPGAVNTRLTQTVLEAGPDRAGTKFFEKTQRQLDQGGAPPEKALDLVRFLLSDASTGLYGKVISALWDDYHMLENLEAISQSDQFTMKRVIDQNGRTKYS